MSFFTNDAYASFRQPPAKPPQASSNLNSVNGLQRRLENASFASNASTASMLSELDPLSPVNLQRAADPWYGNSLSSTSCTGQQEPKVFISDTPLDEDWGEFVNCGPEPRMPPSPEQAKRADSTPRRAKGRTQFYGDSEMASAGWSRFPVGGMDAEPTSLFDDDDDLDDGSFVPYHMPPAPSHQQTQEQPSFVKSLLSRLASFSSLSPRTPSPLPNRPSSSRRGSFGSFSLASSTTPLRNYDTYDITFEKGPIGLELETDWYGRQAVVKGFKKINNSDGPAMACGIIRIGDVLTAINGVSCLELNFQETLARLREVSPCKHTLHFKSLEAAGDLSIYNQDSDIIQAKKFIHQHKEKFYRAPAPCPNRDLILGCIERLSGEHVTTFNFHREDTGEFLLACSCINERTGEFLFHTLQDSHLREWRDLPMNEDSAVFLGRLVPNFLGTEFTLLDHQQKRRNELGFIEYSTNVLGRVPNFMKIAFPKPPPRFGDDELEDDEAEEEIELPNGPQAATTRSTGMGSNNAVFNTSMMDRNGTISERYKRVKQKRSLSIVEKLRSFSLDDVEVDLRLGGGGSSSSTSLAAAWCDDDDHSGQARAMRMKQLHTRGQGSRQDVFTPYGAIEQEDFDCDLVTFETRKPSWNAELRAWTLNFQGRVKLASKKNFLIVGEQGNDAMEAEYGDDTTFLRFGKVAKSRFTLDYQAPLSPLLALAIACSSFARKIAVT